jgi:large subunit ribosomal protein L15
MVEANATINVSELAEQVERYVALGFAAKEGDVYNVNLTEAGIDKLLGTGNIGIAVNVTVAEVSEKARAKIEAAGGSIVE